MMKLYRINLSCNNFSSFPMEALLSPALTEIDISSNKVSVWEGGGGGKGGRGGKGGKGGEGGREGGRGGREEGEEVGEGGGEGEEGEGGGEGRREREEGYSVLVTVWRRACACAAVSQAITSSCPQDNMRNILTFMHGFISFPATNIWFSSSESHRGVHKIEQHACSYLSSSAPCLIGSAHCT